MTATPRLEAEPLVEGDGGLGEGPMWHATERRLYWVELLTPHLHRFDPASGRDEVLDVGAPLCAVAPATGGGLALAVTDGFAHWSEGAGATALVTVITDGGTRMNDGKTDPQGRFWAGSCAPDLSPGCGALYRLDADLTVSTTLTGVTLSNGLDWSDDGRTLFHVDSMAGSISAYDLNPRGEPSNRRLIASVADDTTAPGGMTVPDGLCIDRDGCLWVAVYGTGEVRCFSPHGELLHVVEVPHDAVTSCAFGGEDLADLYITAGIAREPGAAELDVVGAALFRVRTSTAGRPAQPFAGEVRGAG